MSTLLISPEDVLVSGQVVEPGAYKDLETGAILTIHEEDELPEGAKIVRYLRHFRRMETDLDKTGKS